MTLEGAQDKIAELEEEVRFLKSAMGIGVRFPSIFRFTKREQALLGVLATRRVMTHDMMILAAYGNGADGGPETARNVLQVNMVVLRKKLKRFGIVVLSLRQVGYEISERDQQMLREIMLPPITP